MKPEDLKIEGHDFGRLTRRLEALNLADMEMETAGFVGDYPIYCIRLGGDPRGRKRVLLSGGVHGDEPAGPEAVLAFLERNPVDLLRHFTFLILPCVNPFGYVHNRRENREGEDINRSFSEAGVREGEIVRRILKGKRFDLYVDFHEDWEATGFYMYEADAMNGGPDRRSSAKSRRWALSIPTGKRKRTTSPSQGASTRSRRRGAPAGSSQTYIITTRTTCSSSRRPRHGRWHSERPLISRVWIPPWVGPTKIVAADIDVSQSISFEL